MAKLTVYSEIHTKHKNAFCGRIYTFPALNMTVRNVVARLLEVNIHINFQIRAVNTSKIFCTINFSSCSRIYFTDGEFAVEIVCQLWLPEHQLLI
jgi:hypothetical protein